jgi:hypothetical protein
MKRSCADLKLQEMIFDFAGERLYLCQSSVDCTWSTKGDWMFRLWRSCATSDWWWNFFLNIFTGDEMWGLWIWDWKNGNHYCGRGLIHCIPNNTDVPESETSVDCVFDYRSAVPHEYLPVGHMVNLVYYLEVLRHASDMVWRKWLEMWTQEPCTLPWQWLAHTVSRVFDKAFDSCLSTTSLFTWHIPPRPSFLLLKIQQRKLLWIWQMNWERFDIHTLNNASRSEEWEWYITAQTNYFEEVSVTKL